MYKAPVKRWGLYSDLLLMLNYITPPSFPPPEIKIVSRNHYDLDLRTPLILGSGIAIATCFGLQIAVKTEVNRNKQATPLKNPKFQKETKVNEITPPKNQKIGEVTETKKVIPEFNPEQYKEIGLQIIKSFAVSERSQAIVAPSRCGKTTVVYLLLEEFFKKYPDMKCWVWQGKTLEPVHPKILRSQYFLFQIKNPDLTPLNEVFKIYEERQEGDKNRTPVKLIINDWQSIRDCLQASDTKLFKEVVAKIMTISNNGAALNVTVALDTQSANIDDWGLGSGSIRDNFDIYAVARIQWIDGYPKGDLKALPKLITNKDLIPTLKDRERLSSEFEQLRTAMERGEFNTSILLSTVGIYRLGITPTFEILLLSWEGVKKPSDPKQPENKLDDISEIILSIITASEKDWVSFDAIRMSREWGRQGKSNPRTQALEEYIAILIQQGLVFGDKESGYQKQ